MYACYELLAKIHERLGQVAFYSSCHSSRSVCLLAKCLEEVTFKTDLNSENVSFSCFLPEEEQCFISNVLSAWYDRCNIYAVVIEVVFYLSIFIKGGNIT